jgi:hypothetical protein
VRSALLQQLQLQNGATFEPKRLSQLEYITPADLAEAKPTIWISTPDSQVGSWCCNKQPAGMCSILARATSCHLHKAA